MERYKKYIYIIVLLASILILAACSETSENEHLPEYCQTYSGFTDTASRDLYELLSDAKYDVTRYNYLTVISEIDLVFEADDPNREIDLGGIQCFQNLTSLTLIGRSFKDISQISALSNIQSIRLENTSVVSIDSFKNLSKINSLQINNTKTLQSVEGVGEMTKLTTLDLSDNGLVNIGQLNDLVNLENLYLNDNEIVRFPSINNLTNLVTLNIENNNINALGPDLSGLIALETLQASNNEICDISPLDNLESLVTLDLGFNNLGCDNSGESPNFDSLENAPFLETLLLNDNDLESIEGLRNRDINLQTLDIHNNNLTDITPIGEYTGITTLLIHNNNIVDIDDITGMTGLTSIDLSYNSITDFSDLLGITNLEAIYLGHNNITSIPDISTSWDSLNLLDLNSNNLTDTSGVNGHQYLETLILYNNGLTELSGISNMPELDELVIFDEDIEDLLELGDQNPNAIITITNSLNNLSSLDMDNAGTFRFGFTPEDNLEIYSSISGLPGVQIIDFTDYDIKYIDEFSINLPNLQAIYVETTSITDIRFVLGNPNLEQINISETEVSNIYVISGADTSDLDNLTDFIATDIIEDNDLLNAFIDLPSLELIDLSRTSVVTIDGCFNDLPNLETLSIYPNNLQTIENSFNNIFATQAEENRFIWNAGRISVISNSFNGGLYNDIGITAQSALTSITVIENSFNDLVFADNAGLTITGNDFETITGSFNNVDSPNVDLSNNDTVTMTTSFVGTSVDDTLDLSGNLLGDLPLFNLITDVDTLDLSENVLSTLAFIDGISGLTTLDISNQIDVILSIYTLGTLDGINNQPLLTDFTYDDIGITAIDGLQNTGLTSIDLSFGSNNDVEILTVSSTSFQGTPIETLDLDEHELDDLTFLSNLTVLDELYIGVDIADLSAFAGLPAESTLTVLAIISATGISDLSDLENYDVLTGFTWDSPSTVIENFNGLDSLRTFSITESQITEISNSFNNMDNFNPFANYFDAYTNLSTIDQSFGIYGTPGHNNNVIIDSSLTITDGFNNVKEVTIINNSNDVTPNFDVASFDNMTTLTLENGDYTSYAFLNGYAFLTNVIIEVLGENITDLANDNIAILEIEASNILVNTYNLDLSVDSSLVLTSNRIGAINITGDMTNYSVTASNSDIIINATSLDISLTGDYDNMTLNSSTVTDVTLSTFEASIVTFNTDSLALVSRGTTAEVNASSFIINSNEATLDISVRAFEVEIHDDFATDYTMTIDDGHVTLFNILPDLTINHTGQNLTVSYDTLESLDITGSFDDLYASSILLEDINLNTAVLSNMFVTSNKLAFTASSTTATGLELTNDNLTDLSLNTPSANPVITTANNQQLNITATAADMEIVAPAIPNIIIDNTSNITDLTLTTSSLNDIATGTAVVPVIDLTTNETTVNITGSSTSAISIDGATMDTININNENASITLTDTAANIDANLIVNAIDFDIDGIATITLNAASVLSELVINSNTFTSLVTNGISLNSLSVESEQGTINVNAVNALSTTITGNNLTSVTADVGSNILDLDVPGSTAISVDVIANELNFDSGINIISIDNSSVVTTMNITSGALTNILTGTANITTLNITESSTDLDVIGSNITNVNINANINILDINTSITTNVSTVLNANSPITMSTTTSDIALQANQDVVLTGANLENSTLTLGAADIGFIVDKAALDFTLSGTANEVTITGSNVVDITVDGTTNIDTLILNGLDVTTLDFSLGTISNLDITTTETTLDILGNDLITTTINDVSLTSLTVNNTLPSATITINSSQTSLDLIGVIDTITVNNDNLTTLDLSGVNSNDLVVDSDSLATLDTLTNVANSLDLTTTQNNFNLTTNTPTVSVQAGIADTLNLTTSLVGSMTLSTLVDTIDVTGASTDFIISGVNVNNINGIANSIDLTNSSTGTYTIDVVASSFNLEDNTISTLIFIGGNTINDIEVVSSSITSINTNTTAITSFVYNFDNNDTNITTNASQVEIESSNSGSITMVYGNAAALGITLTNVDAASITLSTASSIDVEGNLVDLTIIGSSIDTVATELLTVTNNYTMDDTLIDDLEFVSTDLLTNLVELNVNTLSSANLETILTKLAPSTLTLLSPITNVEVYNYYYNSELTDLTTQEGIDNARYDAERSAAIQAGWDVIIQNEFMDHLDETATKLEIDTQVYQSVEDYFLSFLTAEGTDEETYGAGPSATARAAITATLADAALTIVELDLTTAVTNSIETDADTFATNEQTAQTFTLIN